MLRNAEIRKHPVGKMDLHDEEQVLTFSCATRFKWSGHYGNNDQRHNEARKGAQASKNGAPKQPRGAKMTTWRQTMEF